MTARPAFTRAGIGRAVAILVLAAIVACSWLAPLETAANSQVDKGLKRALVSFAAARALNAIISVAQGTELSLQPLGFGVNLGIGQVLDPVNDVIEQFSTLMLVASVAFGVQKVLLAVGAHWAVSLLLTAAAAGWALLLARGRRPPHSLTQLLVVLLLVRFAIALATLGSDAVFQQFLARDYESSQQVLARTSVQVAQASPATAASSDRQGLLDRLKEWAGAQGAAWKDRFEGLKAAAEQATEHIIKLMVIFILQTLVIPLVLLWGLFAIARAVVRATAPRTAAGAEVRPTSA